MNVRLRGVRRARPARYPLGDRRVGSPVELFDAVAAAMAELKRAPVKIPYRLKVYVVGSMREWFLTEFRADTPMDSVDETCGRIYTWACALSKR